MKLFHVLLQGDTTFPPCLPHQPFDMDEGVGEVFLGLISRMYPRSPRRWEIRGRRKREVWGRRKGLWAFPVLLQINILEDSQASTKTLFSR